MLYETLLCIGMLGLIAQTVLGFMHSGHANHEHAGPGGGNHGGVDQGHAGAAAHSHHGHAHHGNLHHGDLHHGDADSHQHASGNGQDGKSALSFLAPLWGLLSPLTIFSLCLGAGAAGMAAKAYFGNAAVVALIAVAGSVIFYNLLVRPLWNLILGFASTPARSLAGTVAGDAEAVSRFDAQGKGIVRLKMDGQIVQLLAYLEADDREKGVTVAPGEKLIVTSVDGQKNICRVTRL